MTGRCSLTYERGQVPDYVADILAAGDSRLFLPVSFVEEEKRLTAIWHTEGYRRLSAVHQAGTETALNMLVSLLHGIWQTERVYIKAIRFTVDPDVIFVDRGMEEVRMIYMPDQDLRPLKEKLDDLLRGFADQVSGEGLAYLERARSLVQEEGFGHQALMHQLEELRREVYLCGIA